MNYKLIGIWAVVVLGVAGVAYWMLSGKQAQTPAGQQQNNSNLGGYYDTVSNGQGGSQASSSTQGQGAALVDPMVAYIDMFTKLAAKRVSFARTSSGDIYALFAKDVTQSKAWYPAAKDFSIGVAMEDVTDDGVAEALVLDDLPGSCGVAGCPFTIYQKSAAGWKAVFSAQVQSEVGLGNVITNGHTDLYLVQQGTVEPYETAVRHYVWDGKGYVYKDLAASWSGSAFTVYGR